MKYLKLGLKVSLVFMIYLPASALFVFGIPIAIAGDSVYLLPTIELFLSIFIGFMFGFMSYLDDKNII